MKLMAENTINQQRAVSAIWTAFSIFAEVLTCHWPGDLSVSVFFRLQDEFTSYPNHTPCLSCYVSSSFTPHLILKMQSLVLWKLLQ